MEPKLKVAEKLGADKSYIVKKETSEAQTVEDIINLFGGQPDISIDASGAQPSVRLTILVSIFAKKIASIF